MVDELASAITRIIYPALKPEGFRKVRKRDLIRVENGIVQLLYFQVSKWGTRDFCVTACVNLIAANEFVTLNPGFRLTRDTDGAGLWLPSQTQGEAELSAKVILGSIQAEALPYIEQNRTISGLSALLAKEKWPSRHHLSFQRGAVAVLDGDISTARRQLSEAIQLYEADGRDWCEHYIAQATMLLNALANGTATQLLSSWERANSKAHGIR